MKKQTLKKIIFLGIFIIFIVLICFFVCYGFNLKDKDLKVSFLDIGQGDSILIQTPFNQNILIDGGPDSTVLRRLGEDLPWYERTIDLMILTHPHDDHVGGLVYVLKRYKVKKILYTGVDYFSPAYLAWLEIIKKKKIPFKIIDKEQRIIFAKNCFFDVLYPKTSFLNKEIENLNNSSIVTKLVFDKTSFMLTGDIEKEIEHELLERNLKADVLKLGHHGSDTSSEVDFLEKVNPEFAVIQVGEANDFGHPSKRILQRLERMNIKVLRNDLEGTIKFISDGQNIKVLADD